MTPQLKELLFTIRQHPAFREFVDHIEAPTPREFKPSADVQQQWADYIFRSGRRAQHDAWRSFLTENAAPPGA